MLFNSIEFAVFLPVVFLLYWFVFKKNLKLQNIFIILISYVFYGWWDWRFLSLIIISSSVDFFIGNQLAAVSKQKTRKILLLLSVFVNIGFLGFFKYFNFFAENFAQAFSLLGKNPDVNRLNIILPVGISFYTFQTLSYTIDVYKRKLNPTKDIFAFFAFVSFFPQLVAGPIERAKNLLPQFYKKRTFDYSNASDGMRQILWGLFKKIVIADNCAIYANDIFSNYSDYSGTTLILGAFFFAMQIYGDFSGYSDIAIGTARLFSFNLMKNFAFPYFSRDIAEFWRRWHISLSTWFRDYVYIPLGGSRGGNLMKIRNTFIIFLVSGFWHGANWTFIVWGAINAFYFLPLMLLKKNRINTNNVAEGKLFPNFKELLQIGVTFFITLIAWVFFRAENLPHALNYLSHMFLNFSVNPGQFILYVKNSFSLVILLFIIVEWLNREKDHALKIGYLNPSFRYFSYFTVFFLIFFFGNFSQQTFIYFQF
jgi:alginate O-acetyltransferase complex protein AlgI